MPLEKIRALAHDIAARTRILNVEVSKLSGTAVTIPAGSEYPLSEYVGHKVLIYNARYDLERGELRVVITIPYPMDREAAVRVYGGRKLEFSIDESWFPEELGKDKESKRILKASQDSKEGGE